MKGLKLPEELLRKEEVTDIVLDTTGLKTYGEGESRGGSCIIQKAIAKKTINMGADYVPPVKRNPKSF
ncbi:MAG: hypothetical protein M3A24_02650 [Candidatus Rhabdochlamydia oedothoracis]|nr:hypothetical protein [Candidatus Rhabdochlamydia oedothoracis]